MDEREEIRERIISAASALFARYGYGKTSMAEIASGCDMSPGNLYRYFENKLDIAECIVRRSFERTLDEQRRILDQPELTAADRLRRYLLSEMEGTYRQLEDYPTLLDQTQEIRAKRPLLVNEFLSASRELMSDILKNGRDSGEFALDDIAQTAEIIQAATLKFRYPQLHTRLTLDKLKREATGVIDLILNGLR